MRARPHPLALEEVFTHVLSGAWQVRLFSRKNDNMTFKYPDVVAAVRAAQRSDRAFVLDAEIVPVVSPAAAAGGSGALAAAAGAPAGAAEKPEVEVRAFNHLATRKRKDVTAANAAASSTAVQLVLFDLLVLGDAVLLEQPLRQRVRPPPRVEPAASPSSPSAVLRLRARRSHPERAAREAVAARGDARRVRVPRERGRLCHGRRRGPRRRRRSRRQLRRRRVHLGLRSVC